MCRVLEVSASGYYAWRKRPASKRKQDDLAILRRIRTIHEASRQSYGVPRVYKEFVESGEPVGRDRIARLMRSAGLRGVSRRRFVVTTRRDEAARPATDLVNRRFAADEPNRLWVADITYIPTWAGFLYLAVVLDVFSRRVVGWAMATHLRSELVLEALEMASFQRRPDSVIHHSDQGCPALLNNSELLGTISHDAFLPPPGQAATQWWLDLHRKNAPFSLSTRFGTGPPNMPTSNFAWLRSIAPDLNWRKPVVARSGGSR
jgi:hypothetical protein